MSLKQHLNDLIQSRNGGTVTLQEIEDLCKSEKYKLSNAERRLRPSESPGIERVMQNGAIVGYRWTGKKQIYNAPLTQLPRICCYSFKVFQVHDTNCAEVSNKKTQELSRQASMF
jgi:hypothetical protein